ncbi:MAG: hypothetical protein ACOX83_01485 [Candidatus Spyradocola sp.]
MIFLAILFALGTLMGLGAIVCGIVMRKTVGVGGMLSMLIVGALIALVCGIMLRAILYAL